MADMTLIIMPMEKNVRISSSEMPVRSWTKFQRTSKVRRQLRAMSGSPGAAAKPCSCTWSTSGSCMSSR